MVVAIIVYRWRHCYRCRFGYFEHFLAHVVHIKTNATEGNLSHLYVDRVSFVGIDFDGNLLLYS